MRVFLTDGPDEIRYAIGTGRTGATKFDHHSRKYAFERMPCGSPREGEKALAMGEGYDPEGMFPAPCADPSIPVIPEDEPVAIGRFDADTFVGLLRIYGRPLPPVDFELMAEIDVKSKSIVCDRRTDTFCYIIGLEEMAVRVFERLQGQLVLPVEIGPRGTWERRSYVHCHSTFLEELVSQKPLEVTVLAEALAAESAETIIALGRELVEEMEARECLVRQEKNVGLYLVKKGQPSSLARTYRCGVQIAVIYLEKQGRVIISTHPHTHYDFGVRMIDKKTEKKTSVADIVFSGSTHSVGSPRGVACTPEDAERVFRKIVEDPEKYYLEPPKRRGGGGD